MGIPVVKVKAAVQIATCHDVRIVWGMMTADSMAFEFKGQQQQSNRSRIRLYPG